jgi:hypothetical protein
MKRKSMNSTFFSLQSFSTSWGFIVLLHPIEVSVAQRCEAVA